MTMVEKILAKASDKAAVQPGDIVNAGIDVALTTELVSVAAIKGFEEIGVGKVWNPDRVVIIYDHAAPAPNETVAFVHKTVKEFAKKYGINNFYGINAGVCHQVLPEKGFVAPGEVIVGADSHTCTHGAFGAFATGIGSTELAAVLTTGKLWFKVPETIKFEIRGKMPPRITSKDVVLYIIGMKTCEGARYKAVEFAGPAVRLMPISDRMTMCNMVIEMGGKVGFVEPDEQTLDYLKPRVKKQFMPVKPDDDAKYEETIELDISNLEPQVSAPHAVDNVKPISSVEGKWIDQVFIGSCTNGRIEDLRLAAEILHGKKIHPEVRMVVIPASWEVYAQAMRENLLFTFVNSGAVICNPGCGPCYGGHLGIIAPGEVCLSTGNRNFRGRMGKGGEVYLSSPATAAASAIKGEITDPRKL